MTAFLVLSLVSCIMALVQFLVCVSAVVRFQGRFYVSVAVTGCDHCSKVSVSSYTWCSKTEQLL